MNDEIKDLSTRLRELEFMQIIRKLGYETTTVPTWGKDEDGRPFVWHKPFIDDKEAIEALIKFRRGGDL